MLETIKCYIRPLQGALMLFVLLVGACVAGILEMLWPGTGIAFTGGVAGWFRAVPPEYYTLLGALAGVYTIARSAEKISETKAAAPPAPPRGLVDDPDAGK